MMLDVFKVLLCAAALAGALAACSPAPEEKAPEPEVEASVRSSGEVVAVTPEYNAITIRHEAIPEYGMGAMTMEFTVVDPALLTDVGVGDNVTFDLSGPLDISSMTTVEDE